MLPRLRGDLVTVKREVHGKTTYIVKNPAAGTYSQFGEVEIALMGLMDGTRTPARIAEHLERELGIRLEPGPVADFAQKLKRLGLVERTPVEQHLMLAERLRSERKLRAGSGRTRGSILRMRFSVGDPDRLFERMVRRLPVLWSPLFVWVSIALFLAYAVILVIKSREMVEGALALYMHEGVSGWDYLLIYGIFVVVIGIHELGHGLTTKRFGGEVHEIGGMLLYFAPALFCNTSDAWLFQRRSHRLWVTFAGPWIQVIVAAVAAIAWLFMEPGTLLYRVTFLVILVGGVSGVLGNLNPLIPLDGYYALSDWLEIPNLRKRAFGYWGWMVKRTLLGMNVPEPSVTPRERRVFLTYGGLAFAYSVMAATASLIWLTLIVRGLLGPWTFLLLGYILGRLVWRHRGRLRELGMVAARSGRAGFLRGHRVAVVLGALVLLVGLPFVLPWTFRAKGEFRVDAAARAGVFAPVAGILDDVQVAAGDTVRAGQALARVWSPELELDVLALERRAGLLRVARASAEAARDLDAAARAQAALEETESELTLGRARLATTVLRAPIDGVVFAHRLEERRGEFLAEGAPLLEIGSVAGRTARVRLPPTDAGRVFPGQPARLKLPIWPTVVFASTVDRVAPAAREGWLEAEIELPEGRRTPPAGTRGVARIVTGRGTVAEAIGRVVRRLVRLDLWI
jgi:multidrug efflux pump subunit AcrA (membrane-fusion protein)